MENTIEITKEELEAWAAATLDGTVSIASEGNIVAMTLRNNTTNLPIWVINADNPLKSLIRYLIVRGLEKSFPNHIKEEREYKKIGLE